MTKDEMIHKYAEICEITISDAKARFDEWLTVMTLALEEDGFVNLPDFGKLEVRERKERTVIHPITKEAIIAPGRKYVHFKPYKGLMNILNKKNQLIKPINL